MDYDAQTIIIFLLLEEPLHWSYWFYPCLQSHDNQQLEQSFSNQFKFTPLGSFPITFKASSLSMLRFSLYTGHIFFCFSWSIIRPVLFCICPSFCVLGCLLYLFIFTIPFYGLLSITFLKCLTLDGSGLESTSRASGGSWDSQCFKFLKT